MAEDTPRTLEDGALGDASSPIVNGQIDANNDAVVAWLHGSKCSATIVHVDGNTGYALTAAHCLGGSNGTLRQGTNHNSAQRTYDVIEQEVHPRYSETDAYDFAMLKFTGADAATPVIDVLTPAQDDVGVNSPVTLVGYGITPSNNSRRRSADTNVSNDLTNDIYMSYDQSGGNGGVCSGDSGGPPSTKSAVRPTWPPFTRSCRKATSPPARDRRQRARVGSARLVHPAVHQRPAYGRESCDVCFDAHQRGGCQSTIQACFSSNACIQYQNCFGSCVGQACRNACGQENPTGKQLYDAIFACACDNACAVECSGDSMCDPQPACWLDLDDDSCESCLDNACCAEATACSTDTACLSCSTGQSTINCDASPEYVALATCLNDSCGDTCSGFDLPGEGGAGAGGGMGQGGGPAGVGAGPTSGGGEDDDNGETVVTSGCSLSTPGEDAPVIAFLLGLAALGLSRRRS